MRLCLLLVLAACGTSPSVEKAPPPRAAAPAPMPAPAAATEKALLSKGTISLADGKTAEGAAVFVYARAQGVAGGPPLAALKLPPGPFPLAFELTTDEMMPMFRSRPLPEGLSLGFRLDGDGDAMTKTPEEPSATVETKTGSQDLVITLE